MVKFSHFKKTSVLCRNFLREPRMARMNTKIRINMIGSTQMTQMERIGTDFPLRPLRISPFAPLR